MGRLVRHDATGPRKLDESDIDEKKDDIAVCQCGLSDAYPFCDGSHQATLNEEADQCYRYEDDDDQKPRHVVDEVVYAED